MFNKIITELVNIYNTIMNSGIRVYPVKLV